MSQLRWTEFSLTICRESKRRLKHRRRLEKMTGARLSLRGQFVEGLYRGWRQRAPRRLPSRARELGNKEERGTSNRSVQPGGGGGARREVRFKLWQRLKSECTARSPDSVASNRATITTITMVAGIRDGIPGRQSPEKKDSSLRILSAYRWTSEAHYSATSPNHFTGYRSPRPFLQCSSAARAIVVHQKGNRTGNTGETTICIC